MSRPPRSRDIHVNLVVPLETILRGGEEIVSYGRLTPCSRCGGGRAEPGTSPGTCDACDGVGRKVVVRSERRGKTSIRFRSIHICTRCAGSGKRIHKPCTRCHGTGQTHSTETQRVVVPGGAEEAMTVKFTGRGVPAPDSGGRPGDLYVVVTSVPDSRFARYGANLWRDETISVSDAVLGTELEVPTLEGPAKVTVPPGTQVDDVLRVRGRGLPVPRGNGRGDLKVRIKIRSPEPDMVEDRGLYDHLFRLDEIKRLLWR